jgi:hypothetical protein
MRCSPQPLMPDLFSTDKRAKCVDDPNFRGVDGVVVEVLIGKACRVAAQLQLNSIASLHLQASRQETAEAVTRISLPRRLKA